MTEEEEQEYTEQLNMLTCKLDKRDKRVKFFKEKLKNITEYDDIDFYIQELDKMLLECKMDRDLKDDILNLLEVEHFLECGPGRTFDPEY